MDQQVRLRRYTFLHAVTSGWVDRSGAGDVHDRSLAVESRWEGGKAGRDPCYHVYANTGSGEPINYSVCLATVTGQSWTSPALTVPCHFKLGVRAFDSTLGLEEQNVDAVVELVLDASGNDVTRIPAPPLGLRAFSIAGGKVRVEWTIPGGDRSRQPLGFRVYLGTGSVPDYTLPVSTVAWSSARYGCFAAELAGLGNGSPRSIGVRSYNAVAEEQNATVLHVTPDGSPPSVVDSLEVVATNQEP